MNPTIRISDRLIAISLFLLLIASLPCSAQKGAHRGKRLPDSVSTSDEHSSPVSEDLPTIKDTERIVKDTESVITADTTATTSSLHTEEEKPEPAVLRVLPDSVALRYSRDRDFAYANDPDYWKREEENMNRHEGKFLLFLDKLFRSKGFKFFIYILLGGVLLYALYKIIAENNLRLFYRSPGRIPAGGAELTTLAEEDLAERLQQAMLAGDYRLGTRYLFLQSLRLLDERQLIRYHMQATNQEYVRQLSGHAQAQRFRFLTGVYEQVWYGGFTLTSQQFETLFQYYQDFNTSIVPA